jgi:hypothetical protein
MRNNRKWVCDIQTGNGFTMLMMKNLLRHAQKAKRTEEYIQVAMCAPSLSCCLAWPKPQQCTMSLSGSLYIYWNVKLCNVQGNFHIAYNFFEWVIVLVTLTGNLASTKSLCCFIWPVICWCTTRVIGHQTIFYLTLLYYYHTMRSHFGYFLMALFWHYLPPPLIQWLHQTKTVAQYILYSQSPPVPGQGQNFNLKTLRKLFTAKVIMR